MYNILGIGHPRTGTSFTSKLFRLWGLDVGHERLFSDGMVAWQMISESGLNSGPYPYIRPLEEYHEGVLHKSTIKKRPEYKYLIYNVRNPYYSIPSIVYTENISKSSLNFRKTVLKFPICDNPIETAILSLLAYEKKAIELQPDFVFKIENDHVKLYEFLVEKTLDVKYVEHNKKENVRKHKNFSEMISEYGLPSTQAQELINKFCINHGYERTFKT